ncbi:Ig-like domain-containing protein [Salipiger marinus]|uniref:Ig-like domain-containing protein n=1 Tax=Salipiger marinus TaxID=555512 RepID=UPI001E32C158|nr:Ig-like domain-containing protein [Salipiger manganoxidans]MCD1619743.1 hypothetical protein [Salipiger manganoxidans]MEB3420598.1 Ig-like domain-containing protein [Salipiger manganoxidans]
MEAIGFVIRTRAGAVESGHAGGGGQEGVIDAAPGSQISFDLDPADIQSFRQSGEDLRIVLADGAALLLAGYFAGPDRPELFVRSGAMLLPVLRGSDLAAPADRGSVLRLTDALPLPHLRSIAAESGDDLMTVDHREEGLSLTGTAPAGSRVSVTVAGRDHAATVVPDGRWSLLLTAPDAEGWLGEAEVTVTDLSGNALTRTHRIATECEMTAPPEDQQMEAPLPLTGEEAFRAEELRTGVLLTGMAEAGAMVMVELAGLSQQALTEADGSWSVAFSDLASGSYATEAKVTATDAEGNSATATHGFQIDTDLSVSLGGPITFNGGVNAAEEAGGLALTGQTDPDAAITLVLDGRSHSVMADGEGAWLLTVPPDDLRMGIYETGISVTATDAAGNRATTTGTLTVDTQTSVGVAVEGEAADGAADAAGLAPEAKTDPHRCMSQQ